MTTQLREKRHFLEVLNLITTQGEKRDNTYEYNGIRAWHDFDGYTCWLAFEDVTITLLFHNKFQIDYDKPETYNVFTNKVAQILSKR